ncbi:MAG TPA: LysR substrate-binding domain-containing protein [Allosphingosinicella sp.]
MLAPSHLKSLQALEMAVRTGSFTAAADRLAISPAAVGQRVKALEEYLGIELLVRGRAGIRPSPELTGALPHLAEAFGALELAVHELDLQRGQELHVAAASDFVELWLKPRLDAFRAAHPNILFCINGDGDAPMRLGKVDCEIAFGPLPEDPDSDLLFRDFIVPIGSPANVARTGDLPAERRLEGFPLLHLDLYKDDPAGLSWPAWCARNGIARTAPDRGMRFQRITAALDAVLASAGLSLCGVGMLLDRIASGSIGLPYPISTGHWSEHAYVARFRQDAALRPHVVRFREWLLRESRATAQGLQHWLG